MRDQGLISLDDTVEQYIPSFRPLNPYQTRRKITLRQLASHLSGLSREEPCLAQRDNCTEAEIMELIAKRWLVLPQVLISQSFCL
jgi:CubicO group peptidase (beta-lactamase class C family)